MGSDDLFSFGKLEIRISEAVQENVPNGTPERKEEQEERFLESVRQFWVSGQSTVRTDVSPPPE
jgi:hypothetical protein